MSKKIVKGGGSNTAIKNTSKPLEESILDIINDISKRQYSLDFREPVDVKALGLSDYYDIVKKPMDISTLKNNFLEGVYKTIKEVWEDFDLIVNNCKAYNRIPDHPINQKADQMKSRVDKNFQKLLEDYKALGVDTDGYQIQIDLDDLKAKEEKKRKIKLDGLDEKNILIGGDKRLNLIPGSLNERKFFELSNQELQMMQAGKNIQMLPLNQPLQQEDPVFQPTSLKISLNAPNLSLNLSNSTITGEQPTPTNNQVGMKQPRITGDNTQKVKKQKDYSAKIQELQTLLAQLKLELEVQTKKKSDVEKQRILCKNVYILSKKQRRGVHQLVQQFETEENTLINPEGTLNNFSTQSNLNGSEHINAQDINDAATSGTSLKTPQKREDNGNLDDQTAKKMEIENKEIQKSQDQEGRYNDDDDDDNDIIIKKKSNFIDDLSLKQNESTSQIGSNKIKIPTSQTLNKEANSSTQLNDSKISLKQSQIGQKSNNDSFSTPTKQQLLNSSNLSSEKIKQSSKTNNLNASESKFQSNTNDGEESEEEFVPQSLNTSKQTPSDSLATPQQTNSIKLHGLKPTSSTANSAHLKHKLHASASGDKIQIKKPTDLNSSLRKEGVTPEKILSQAKKDFTPEKSGSSGKQLANQQAKQLGNGNNPQKVRPNGHLNGQTNSQSNLSPQSQELKKKLNANTPTKSALSQGKSTMSGNVLQKKNPSSDSIIKVKIGGESIQKSVQDLNANKIKRPEDEIKIKLKDSTFKTAEKDGEERKVNKITIPNPQAAGGNFLPTPELKQSQSLKAAQIIQMGQEKKNREMEEKQKTEEQKRLEELKKRQNRLKKKEQMLLQAHQQKQAEAAAAAAAAALANNEVSDKPVNTSEPPKIILMKSQSLKPEEGASTGSNLIKIPFDASLAKMSSTQSQPNSQLDIGYNSRQIYDKIIPSKPKKTQSIQQEQNANTSNSQNLNFNKIKINVGGSPVMPPANNPSIQNFPIPQISVGGERVDFKFVLDRKALKKEYENMIKRKQLKYKKLLELNLTKMQKVTNWMIREWAKQKKDVRSETLDYFRDILNERQKIKDNLDIRKIQLFLKMFLYRLRDFYKDLKPDYIDKLKNISEKLYRIGSRAIVYKTPLSIRDNPKNASLDTQVSNNQILDESHPLKKLQEEILEIEREMKLFRRMLSRDIQKYQEPDATTQKSKKSKNKDDGSQYNGGNDNDQQGGYMNGGQGYDDSKDAIYGMGDKDQQQKQSEILSFFLEYNKSFEKHSSNLQKIQHFLAYQNYSNILNQLQSKNPIKSDQLFDICETFVEDENNNQVEILQYFKKKRKISEHTSSESMTNNNNDTKIEEEGKQKQNDQEIDELNSNIFDNVTLSFNFNLDSKKEDEEGKENTFISKSQDNSFNNPKQAINVFSQFDDDEDDSTEAIMEERKYQEFKSKINQKNLKECNSGSDILGKNISDINISNVINPEFDYFGVKKLNQMINNKVINKKFCQNINSFIKQKFQIVEINKIKCKNAIIYQKMKTNDDLVKNLYQKQQLLEPKINIKIAPPFLDDLNINCLQTLINLQIQVELRLENEQNPKSQMDIENSQNNQAEKSLEFHIQNNVNYACCAYFTELPNIKDEIQLNCKENADFYSILCQEDVEQVVQSFKIQKQLYRLLSQDSFLTQEVINSEAVCITKQRLRQIDPQNNKFLLEISLWTPTDNLGYLSIKLNNEEIFSPLNFIQKIKKFQQYQIQQKQIQQQQQQQLQQQQKKYIQNQSQ
ncbi:bromodomain protein (macronuclear) [Tetrahymena thermophila SB210]|uniref:Bromodomain protein n=1 Tax=Tetrahymena thermophila (strain SB210) TaxID=312017 RepID=I7M649_TETTS|nr:bromodomain protein [Tetrahymena thermophila SB210]EAR84277.2 bromodomain protein [Tetrahymena thermophila SB210]|eukprot:XP_001031940.2 bromodomain protein [Tetrahymena thermophila SB210]